MDTKDLVDKLNEFPGLRRRIEEMVRIIENTDGKTTRSDDAEQCVIDELQGTGKEIMQNWAARQSEKAATQIDKGLSKQVRKRGKKK